MLGDLLRRFASTFFAEQDIISRCKRAEYMISPDAEKMKFTSEHQRQMISVAAHAQSNATMHHEQASREVRKSGDALAELARGFQGRH